MVTIAPPPRASRRWDSVLHRREVAAKVHRHHRSTRRGRCRRDVRGFVGEGWLHSGRYGEERIDAASRCAAGVEQAQPRKSDLPRRTRRHGSRFHPWRRCCNGCGGRWVSTATAPTKRSRSAARSCLRLPRRAGGAAGPRQRPSLSIRSIHLGSSASRGMSRRIVTFSSVARTYLTVLDAPTPSHLDVYRGGCLRGKRGRDPSRAAGLPPIARSPPAIRRGVWRDGIWMSPGECRII